MLRKAFGIVTYHNSNIYCFIAQPLHEYEGVDKAHLMPGVAKVISISVRDSDEGLDGVNVLLLHLCDTGASCEQSEPGQGLDICISLQLQRHTQVRKQSRN